MLPCSFRDYDYGLFPLSNPVPKHLQQAAAALELKRDLGNQTEIDVLRRQRRKTANESGMPSHELHQSDSIYGADRFHIGGRNRFHCFREPSLEPAALVDVHDVFVEAFPGRARTAALPLRIRTGYRRSASCRRDFTVR